MEKFPSLHIPNPLLFPLTPGSDHKVVAGSGWREESTAHVADFRGDAGGVQVPPTQSLGGQQSSLKEVGETSSNYTQGRRSRETFSLRGFDSTTKSTKSCCLLYHSSFVKLLRIAHFTLQLFGDFKKFLTVSRSLGKRTPTQAYVNHSYSGQTNVLEKPKPRGTEK